MASESKIAAKILINALDLDKKKRYTEALICYQEGLNILIDVMRGMTNAEEKSRLGNRISEYMGRAETIKKQVEIEKEQNSYHEQIIIESDSCGHSYQAIFGRFFDSSVNEIQVDDPYIRMFHQCQNFLRFCELAVKKCENLKTIILNTIASNGEQDQWLRLLHDELKKYHKELKIVYSSTLHDREVRLDNGWIIKIGRGLDYFKGPESKFAIGAFDMDLRKCHETTVDIFHNKRTIKRFG